MGAKPRRSSRLLFIGRSESTSRWFDMNFVRQLIRRGMRESFTHVRRAQHDDAGNKDARKRTALSLASGVAGL